VFYLSYVRSELVRRKGRTILTVLGLALGVALVIVISSLSRGLDHAQKTALNPLSSIGTDLTVTLKPQQQSTGFGGPGGGNQTTQSNLNAVQTDLSKLGKPGTHFVHDFFLPGTQLTFPQSQASEIAALSGVSAVSSGLVLSGVHQEGTVPKIVAKIKTGGRRFRVSGRVRFQFNPAQQEKIRACIQKAFQSSGGTAGRGTNGGGLGGGGGNLGGGGGGGGGFLSNPAIRKCLPAQVRNFSRTFVTPQQTIEQAVDPPQTNITATTYTIAGEDPAHPSIGLVTPALVTSGRFLTGNGQALLAATYASRNKLKVGSKLDLNGTTFTVVGLVKPPLGGQTADVYIPLAQLQALSSQKNDVNVVLVRASNGSSVASVQKEIEQQFPNAQVASSKQVADQISGSLVDASNLSHRLGVALAALAACAAFLLAALLTLSSVGKRVRELGTLKALGWTQRLVVRQVVGESLAQGLVGGLLGVVLGVVAAAAISASAPTLTATSVTGAGQAAFGLGSLAARSASQAVKLDAPIAVEVLLLGFVLALAGGLIAGAAGAFRAARLRPADALRTVE
jgi:putative ABC transport system permease protein